ncbi:thyroid receptor-interacting protein 6-like [Ptychodera flava]|uniref:thyroid receptor-interacting protein 6-like n=1 Tax=Ptychodera flava TaxID=63121 RepID=UPI00396AACDE
MPVKIDRNRDEIKCAREKCGKEILGTIIIALEKTWHIGCFLCCKCRTELRNKKFILGKDNQTYCEKDYKKFQGTDKCECCKDPVVGVILFAGGKAWHPECFKCYGCGGRIAGSSFAEMDGHRYCNEDCRQKIPKVGEEKSEKGKKKAQPTELLKRPGRIVVFKCEECQSSRKKRYFVRRDGKLHCAKCKRERAKRDEPNQNTSFSAGRGNHSGGKTLSLPNIRRPRTVGEFRKSSNM